MPALRILHLSDLHLAGIYKVQYEKFDRTTKLLAVYNQDALEAITEIIYRWRDNLDGILISGDIAVTGSESDLKRAIEFFVTPANSFPEKTWEAPWLNHKGEPTLQVFNKPIIIVPGNHDRYCNRLAWPGKLFYNYFSSYWTVGSGGIQTYFIPDIENPILAIICTDLSLDSIAHATLPFGHFGQGKVYDNRLQDLVKATEMINRSYPSCAIIWMIHFAPKFEESPKFQEYLNSARAFTRVTQKLLLSLTQLINDDKLIEQAEGAKIKYLFCGHTHFNDYYRTGENRSVWIHCAGTSTCIRPNSNPTIHLKDIIIENGKVQEIRSRDLQWNPDHQTFL